VEALGQALLERQPAAAAAGAVQEEQRRAPAVAQQIDGRVADGDPGGLGHGPSFYLDRRRHRHPPESARIETRPPAPVTRKPARTPSAWVMVPTRKAPNGVMPANISVCRLMTRP